MKETRGNGGARQEGQGGLRLREMLKEGGKQRTRHTPGQRFFSFLPFWLCHWDRSPFPSSRVLRIARASTTKNRPPWWISRRRGSRAHSSCACAWKISSGSAVTGTVGAIL